MDALFFSVSFFLFLFYFCQFFSYFELKLFSTVLWNRIMVVKENEKLTEIKKKKKKRNGKKKSIHCQDAPKLVVLVKKKFSSSIIVLKKI